MDEKVKIKATRNFYYERVLYEPGAVLEVSRALSIELISLSKAEIFVVELKKEKDKAPDLNKKNKAASAAEGDPNDK